SKCARDWRWNRDTPPRATSAQCSTIFSPAGESGTEMVRPAKLLLKARPTPSQLADRLRPVDGIWPDGLELYLAAADLASEDTVEEIAVRISSAPVPEGFAWLIEGPVDSLDGGDFDVSRESE